DRLYLSYVAREAQTGDKLEPSPVVHELLRYLHRGRAGSPEMSWVNEQPLRRYDDSYFSRRARSPLQVPRPANFSRVARREWQARELRKSLCDHGAVLAQLSPGFVWQLSEPVARWLGLHPWEASRLVTVKPEHVPVSFRSLRRFLECPLQGWAQLQLGLSGDEVEAEAVREDEPFTMNRLDETILLREVFVEANGDADLFGPIYDRCVESRMRRGLMPIGMFGDAERRRHLNWLSLWHESAQQANLIGLGT